MHTGKHHVCVVAGGDVERAPGELFAGLGHISVDGTATINSASSGTTAFYVTGDATVHEQNGCYDIYRILPGGTLNVDGQMRNEYFQVQGGDIGFNGAETGSVSGYASFGSVVGAVFALVTNIRIF